MSGDEKTQKQPTEGFCVGGVTSVQLSVAGRKALTVFCAHAINRIFEYLPVLDFLDRVLRAPSDDCIVLLEKFNVHEINDRKGEERSKAVI